MSPDLGSQRIRKFFRGAVLEAEDLMLLEAFQISYLPGWIPEREFAVVLHAYPHVATYLRKRQPGIASFVDRVIEDYPPARGGPAGDPEGPAREGTQING